MKQDQKDFDIDAFQNELIEEKQKAEPNNPRVASEVKHQLYGSVISEKKCREAMSC